MATYDLSKETNSLDRTLPTDLDIDGLNPITCQAIILHCRGLSRNEICKILNRSTAWHQKQFSTPAVKSAIAALKLDLIQRSNNRLIALLDDSITALEGIIRSRP